MKQGMGATPFALLLSTSLVLLAVSGLRAQVGGDNVFEFVNLSNSARVSALGGSLITVRDDDINLAYFNPASLNPDMHQSLAFSHSFFLAGVQHGYAAYGHHLSGPGITLHGGVQYISYGTFDRTDEFGNTDGTFKAGEYALTFGAGRQVNERLTLGANLKVISSSLESYHSTGLLGDLAAFYSDTSRNLTFTFLFRNIGGQLTAYNEGNTEPTPFEIQAGISKRLRYLPFRLSVIYHNLQRWNITYDDPNQEEPTFLFGEEPGSGGSPFVDNLLRHFIFSGEFLFGKKENFRLRFGYSHFRQKEMKVNNLRSLAGFSFGMGLKINRFRIDVGRSLYHLAGGNTHFSLSTNIREFRK